MLITHYIHTPIQTGCGSVIQAAQWQSIFKSTGFSVEADVRIITDSEARVQAKRRVNPQQTLFVHHYVVVAWLGKRRIHNRGFGFLLPKQKRGYVFSGMPTCAPVHRLCDDTGCIVRLCEKHIAEPLEMIWTFFGATNAASATFCDFFSGSGVAGLAALRANFSSIILNDRDTKVKPFVESRMRHYLQWLLKDRGGEEWPGVGLELRGKGLKYSGISPYTFAQLEMKKATHDGELQLTLRSTPFDYQQEVFLHQNNLAIKPSEIIGGGHKGLFVEGQQTSGRNRDTIVWEVHASAQRGPRRQDRVCSTCAHQWGPEVTVFAY